MKICFFGNISGALKGKTAGGAELQIALLARVLALKGQEVVIIDPDSSESFESIEGIKLINVPDWNKGVKGFRLFRYRIPALKKLFIDQHADYYYIRMRYYLHLICYIAAKKNKAKLIQAVASDVDVLNLFGKFKSQHKSNFNLLKYLTRDLPNDLVYNYLFKKADYIFLQHTGQKSKLNSVKGKIVVFPNIFDFRILPKNKISPAEYFIHPGTLNMLKGSDNLNQLIKMLDKKLLIVIVGEPTDKKSKIIYEKFRKIENVILKGRLSHAETIELIANAKALINTSNFEGFPNIFLEAWASGVPVISLNVNPGNVFNKYDLGIYCDGNLNKMKTSIEFFKTKNFDKGKFFSYISEFHDFRTAGDRFLNIINHP